MRRMLLIGSCVLVPSVILAEPDLYWVVTYDGGAAADDISTVALTAPNGDLVVGGESNDGVDGSDMLICRFDREMGDITWQRRVPAPDGLDMALTGMVWDGNSDILVGGYVRGCVG
jgi:hypothetical protein